MRERIRFAWSVTLAGWRWLVEVTSNVGAGATILLALGASTLSAVTLPHWWLGLVVLGAFYGILFAEGAYRVLRETDSRAAEAEAHAAAAALAPRPHLLFKEPEVAEASVVTGHFRPTGTSVAMRHSEVAHWFARINVANDPPPGTRGATAERLIATISFRADNGSHPVAGMVGRWAETPQRMETGRLGISLEEAQLDLVPNGLNHPVDIAMKRPGDASCFAFNYENANALELRLPKHELTEAQYLVQVTLRGANVEPIGADYVLTNNPGVPLQLRGPYPPADYGDREIAVASGVAG